MGESFVEKTQSTLGKVIQRPTLSEKHLSRPPFRFLHDIVTQLIKKTGFFHGLFPAEMLDSKNVTDKEAKVRFLQAVIACTTLVYGKEITVKASSIVAGKEPENTNKLLQIIGKCILEKKTSDEAVEKLKSKSKSKKTEEKVIEEKSEKANKKDRKSSKDSSKEREKDGNRRDRKERSESKSRKSDKTEKGDERKRSSDRDRRGSNERRGSGRERSGSNRRPSIEKENKEVKEHKRERSSKKKETPEEREKRKEAEREERRRLRKLEKSGRPPRPTSAKGDRRAHVSDKKQKSVLPMESEEPLEKDKNESSKKLRERPTSARPAKRVKAPNLQDQQQPAAPINRNVIIDGENDDDDDDEPPFEELLEMDQKLNNLEIKDEDSHGALVRDIIESKKNIENDKGKRRTVLSEAEEQKARKQTEQLQGDIQQISRTTAPIGRILDFIQEDMDSMQTEYELWNDELTKNTLLINQGTKANDDSLKRSFDELDELESSIISKRNEINSTKQRIFLNKNLIEKQVKMMLS